jgi:hypothetical protein
MGKLTVILVVCATVAGACAGGPPGGHESPPGVGGNDDPGGTGGKTPGGAGGGGRADGSGGTTPSGGSGGTAPVNPGTGGVNPGTGGANPGTGGANPGTGGANPDAGPARPDPSDGGGSGAGGVGAPPPTAGTLGSGNPTSTGLDRHDALYCGEWQKTTKPGDTIYLVKGGKVVWSYSLNTSGGNEFGDCTLTSYGTVFYPLKNSGAFEIKVDLAKGKATSDDIVWSYKQDAGTEVHSVQPIGKNKALVMQNGNPAKLMLINKDLAKVCTSGAPCVEKTWNPDSGGKVHGMFRHVRMLANGNLLVPHMGGGSSGHVKEYTQDWKVVWDYNPGGQPWAAVRLHNGNTLVSGNMAGWVREVSPDLKVVWEVTRADFPSQMYLAQGAHRLKNGNTLISNWCGPAATGQWPSTVQYFEVTPDKKFVWQVKQWDNPNLGPGSSIQALDDPGVPENPGDLQR